MPDATQFDDDKLVVFSDYLCPFCYLGKASLESYLDDADESVDIEWRPFDLQGHKRGPDGEVDSSVDDGKDEAYFERAKENVRRLQEKYGVDMTMDLARDVDSWNAHKAALWARDEADSSTFRQFNDAIFAALWREGRDIGDPDVLADLADEVGLPADGVREAVASDELDERLEEEFGEARQVGIRGVPTFFFGDRGTQGAVPPEQFERLLE